MNNQISYEVGHIEPLSRDGQNKYIVTRHRVGDLVKVVFDAAPMSKYNEHHGLVWNLYNTKNIFEKTAVNQDGTEFDILGGGKVLHNNGEVYLHGQSADFGCPELEDLLNLGLKVMGAYNSIAPANRIAIERRGKTVMLVQTEAIKSFNENYSIINL